MRLRDTRADFHPVLRRSARFRALYPDGIMRYNAASAQSHYVRAGQELGAREASAFVEVADDAHSSQTDEAVPNLTQLLSAQE